jgi:transposase
MEDAVMPRPIVTDELWSVVEPLLPRHEASPKGGHPPKGDRLCLTGILFVLKTGIAWEDFPQEMGCCGMTLWNRLDAWRRAGVWKALHAALLTRMHRADLIDWSRATADSASVRAVRGGEKPAPAPWTAAREARSTTY